MSFVEDVTKNFTQIRENGNRLLLVKENALPHAVAIELRPTQDGNYYGVSTAGVFNRRYISNKELLWERNPQLSSPGKPEPPSTTTYTNPKKPLGEDAWRTGTKAAPLLLMYNNPNESVNGQAI
ncbi:MAG: hypothetical protein HQL03_15840 [Nitrospirae bacterium]|nr:hypothetical protein [Nitrospirota bacterium]